tara:strand:- start:1393 stop:1788 length:396 start_codon:yes stop_codon:yes gene_type:complete
MAATFTRVTGHQHCQKFTSSGTMAAGTLVQFDESGVVAVAATNKSVAGILLEAAASSNVVLVDMITAGDKVKATGLGITLTASSVGATFDLSAGSDLASSSNKDVVCADFISATSGNFWFQKTVRGGSILV